MRELFAVFPEIILVLTLAFVVAAEITYHGERVRFVAAITLVGLGAAFVQTIVTYRLGSVQVFNGALSVDGFSLFFKLLFIGLAGFSVVTMVQTREIDPRRRTEFLALLVASTLALSLSAAASDLLLIFLTLQLVNILVYFLAGYGKRSHFSAEAAMKYMVLSSFSAALFLYGLAILFSFTHAFNLSAVHKALVAQPLPREAMLSIFVLVFLPLGFQLGAFPMSFWAPDVLEGAPTPSSAFLSFGPRAGGLAVALRLLIGVFAQPSAQPGAMAGQWEVLGAVDWTKIVALVAGATMLLGSLLALRQTAAKRMVACLVVSESGFLLLGLLVLDQVGISAALYNLVLDLVALMGVFHVLTFFHDQLGSDRYVSFKGMLRKFVAECICLVLFLLCLVGMPPTPGFIAKFILIGAVVRHQWPVLAAIAVVSMTISSAAVIQLLFHLVGDFQVVIAGKPAQEATLQESRSRRVFLFAALAPMFLAGIFAEAVLDWASKSLGFIFW